MLIKLCVTVSLFHDLKMILKLEVDLTACLKLYIECFNEKTDEKNLCFIVYTDK